MKTVVGMLMAAALCALPVLGQQGGKKAEDETYDGPRMEVAPELHDFGKAKQNEKLTTQFKITNVGSEELKIGRISTSCGCTAAQPSKKLLAPGESTSLKVTFETRRYKGPVQRSVSIASNDPRRVLTVKLKVYVEEGTGSDRI